MAEEVRVTLSGPPKRAAAEIRRLADDLEAGNKSPDPLYVDGNGGPNVIIDFDLDESYADDGGDRLLAEVDES